MRTCLGFPSWVLAACFAFFPPLPYLSSELPFSVLHFLISPSCFFFFFDSSMVDYSAVRANCPSIAFFFAYLGSLLESVGGSILRESVPS